MIPLAWRSGRPGQALAMGCGVMALLLIWLAAISPVWSWYADRQAMLEQRRALLVRMQRLAASLPAAREASAHREDGAEEASAMLPGTTDALAAAALQEAVQKMATAAGANLTAVETLPAATDDRWHKVSLRISLNAPWPVLVELMHAVERGQSRIFVGDVRFHSPVVVTHPASLPIQASMVLYGFRPAEAGSGA
jgi:type II secretory pathway component PulM